MQPYSDTRKLLLGICLFMLWDRAISAPMTAQEQDQLMSQLSIQSDQLFNGRMNCPSYVVDDVKKCVMAEAKKENDDICVVMKNVWGCQKDGVLKCDEGKEVWKFTAPTLNNVTKSLGCPATNMDGTQPESGMTTFAPRIKAIPMISTAIYVLSKISLAPTNADQGYSHTLFYGLVFFCAVICSVIGHIIGKRARNRRSGGDGKNGEYNQFAK